MILQTRSTVLVWWEFGRKRCHTPSLGDGYRREQLPTSEIALSCTKGFGYVASLWSLYGGFPSFLVEIITIILYVAVITNLYVALYRCQKCLQDIDYFFLHISTTTAFTLQKGGKPRQKRAVLLIKFFSLDCTCCKVKSKLAPNP